MWVDLGSIPGSGRFPGEGKVYPLQYSGLENSMDCIVHGVAEPVLTPVRAKVTNFKIVFVILALPYVFLESICQVQ